MAFPIRLRIILGENSSQKVVLQDGVPNSLDDLAEEIQKQCNLHSHFRLQFMDPDFDNEFMNLVSTSDIQDKCTLKVVFQPDSTADMQAHCQYKKPPVPFGEVSDNRNISPVQSPSLSSCDTLILSSSATTSISSSEDSLGSPESASILKTTAWPTVFTVPKFSFDAELKLQKANAAFQTDGTLLSPDHKLKSSILDGLAEEIVKYKVYLCDAEFTEVADALIKKHPCLKEPGSVTGFCGWKTSLKYKLGNCRTKLRNLGCPAVTVNSLKHKPEGKRSPAYAVKKARKAEVNYCPSYPKGETSDSLETMRIALLSEVQKKNNEQSIRTLMDKTFALRRHELLQQSPLIADFKTRWPALFSVKEVNAEFERITTVPLVSKFFSKLDLYSANLVKVFSGRGGVQGQRIRSLMMAMEQSDDIEIKRECILKALCLYMNERSENLIREYVHADVSSNEQDLQRITLGIYVVRAEGAHAGDPPADVGVLLEGLLVLEDLGNIPFALAVLFGLIYVLNLSYPPELRYMFEIIQKLFFEMDANQLSRKAQVLKIKLFRE